MLSKSIYNMLNGDNFLILKNISEILPNEFKKIVNNIHNNESFFVSNLKNNNELSFTINLLQLCESFGYCLNLELAENNQNNQNNKILNKNKPKFIPEYISILNIINNDDSFLEITKKLGQEYILNLEKNGWPILETAYKKNLIKSIYLLSDFGCNNETSPNGNSILQISEQSQKLINVYWDIKNKKHNNLIVENLEFEHFLKTINKLTSSIYQKKDFHTEQVLNLVLEKKERLDYEQKKILLQKAITVLDPRLYKGILKLLNLKQNSKEFKDLIFPHLNTVIQHEFIFLFLEEKDYLFKNINKEKNIYGIELINETINNLNLNPFDKYYSNNKSLINISLTKRLLNLFKSQNILFEKFDNQQTLFEKIALLSNNRLSKLLDVFPKIQSEVNTSIFKTITFEQKEKFDNSDFDFNEIQKKEIRIILEKTWLSHDSNNISLMNKIELNTIFFQKTWLFNHKFFLDKSNIIFKEQEKIEIFQKLINNITKIKNNAILHLFTSNFNNNKWSEIDINENLDIKIIKSIYLNLKQSKTTNWANINLDELTLKNLKDTEFLFELNALKFQQQLKNNLTTKNVIFKKNIKI